MKRAVVVFVVLFLLIGGVAYAGYLPPDTEEFRNDCGYICYVWPDGSGNCYPCLECEVCTQCTPTEEPTPPPPTDTPVPPTETPVPPTEKPKCNRGLGNGSEDCDPGNSGGKPGAAGEDNE